MKRKTRRAIDARRIRDINYISNVSLRGTRKRSTKPFNLVQHVPYPVTEQVLVSIMTRNARGAKNCLVTMEHAPARSPNSKSPGRFEPIPQLTPLRILNSSIVSILIPVDCKQFIRASVCGNAKRGKMVMALDF